MRYPNPDNRPQEKTLEQPTTTVTPEIKAEADRCVLCGLCLPHCPTYIEYKEEAESPRGRISLIQGLATGELEATPKLQAHLDSCLLCRACEAKCPSGVRFGWLMDKTRETIAEISPTSHPETTRIKQLATDKKRQQQTARWLSLYQRSGLQKLARYSGLVKLSGQETLEQQLPQIPPPKPWREHYPAQGKRVGSVALFTGCIASTFDSTTLDAAIQLLTYCGYDLHLPAAQTCCGAMHLHSGEKMAAEQLCQQNHKAFADLEIEQIIFTASGCGATLSELEQFNGRVTEISAFLCQIQWPQKECFRPFSKRVAIHDPCSLKNVLRGADAPYQLLRKIPAIELISLPGNERCCGAAGTYMIEHPEMAETLRDDKLESIKALQPEILVTSNIGCSWHLAAGIKKAGKKIETMHPITLLTRQLIPI